MFTFVAGTVPRLGLYCRRKHQPDARQPPSPSIQLRVTNGGADGARDGVPMQSNLPPVLSTNIQVPRAAAELIERPRLLGLLPTVRTKLLSVIKGPAGFAKTSVALAWARALESPDCRVAWVTLDPNDDVPTRLLFSAVHALQRASEGL